MPNPENLEGHAWEKGQSGNPGGRGKGTLGLTQTMRKILDSDGSMTIDKVYEVDNNGKETGNVFERAKVRIPKKDMIILAALKKAIKGDTRAISFIFDRIEGRPKQQIEMEAKQVVEFKNVSKQFPDE